MSKRKIVGLFLIIPNTIAGLYFLFYVMAMPLDDRPWMIWQPWIAVLTGAFSLFMLGVFLVMGTDL